MQFHENKKAIFYFNPKMGHMLDLAIVQKLNRAGFVVAPYNTPEEESSVKTLPPLWTFEKRFGNERLIWIPRARSSQWSGILENPLLLQERWSRIFTVFDNGQSNIVSRRPRRLAYGRRIRFMRRRVIVDLASAGPLEVKFIITLRRKHARYRVPTVWTRASGRIQTATFKQKICRFFENSQ